MEDGQDMICIYCKWFSARWQWSVNLNKNRKKSGVYKRRNSRPHPKKRTLMKKIDQVDVFGHVEFITHEAEEN